MNNESEATRYLVQTGHLSYCEYHDEISDGGLELDSDFYRDATIAKQEGRLPWAARMTQRQFTDALKEAYDEGSDAFHCSMCQRQYLE